jgi:uncharacterized membrane protein
MSEDGQVVVGTDSNLLPQRAVRWTAATGAVVLPAPTSGPFVAAGLTTLALGVNGDGSVVVGNFNATIFENGQFFGVGAPFRWNAATNSSETLLRPDGSLLRASPTDVSSDGNVIVLAGELSRGLRWTRETGGVQVIASLVGSFMEPRISGDGNTIIACDGNFVGQNLIPTARFWNINTGERLLTDVLSSAGCDFSGWTNLVATGLDHDGNTLCGYATNPTGQTEAWYATIPTPGATATISIGAMLPTLRRRRSCCPETAANL